MTSFFLSISSLFLVLLNAIPLTGIFFCIRCDDCSHRNFAPERCPHNVHGCVTMRISRTEVIRDCYTWERISQGCDIAHMANKTCTYCDDYYGCNWEQPDAIVCRSCDWTTSGTCAVQRVCRSPFRSETPLCFIQYHYPLGFYFGCLDEMSKGLEFIMAQDPHRITHRWCDSNDCNWHAKNFWPDWDRLLDPFRICHVCFKDSGHCGPKVCATEGQYSRFCMRTTNNVNALCMSDIDRLTLNRWMNSANDYVCGSDNCNEDLKALRHVCERDHRQKEVVYQLRDGCAMFKSESSFIFIR